MKHRGNHVVDSQVSHRFFRELVTYLLCLQRLYDGNIHFRLRLRDMQELYIAEGSLRAIRPYKTRTTRCLASMWLSSLQGRDD